MLENDWYSYLWAIYSISLRHSLTTNISTIIKIIHQKSHEKGDESTINKKLFDCFSTPLFHPMHVQTDFLSRGIRNIRSEKPLMNKNKVRWPTCHLTILKQKHDNNGVFIPSDDGFSIEACRKYLPINNRCTYSEQELLILYLTFNFFLPYIFIDIICNI